MFKRALSTVSILTIAAACVACGGAETSGDETGSPLGDPLRVGAWAGQSSGLGWKTGFANGDRANEFDHLEADEAGYLHRETDVYASFLTHDVLADTQHWVDTDKKAFWAQLSSKNVRVLQVVPLLFGEHQQQVAQVIGKGSLHDAYIAFWKDMGTQLAAAGAKAPILRLGHEMNLGGGYPWSNITPQQFVALYRLAADAIQSTKPDAIRCWNPGKGTTFGTTDQFWPGDDYVDVVGVDWYDNGSHIPMITSDQVWTDNYLKSDASGPIGIGAWYAYAKAHKKPIAFPEWALTDHTFNEPDRPLYIQHMHDFFKMAAAEGNMAFESYYNAVDTHQLYPVTSYFKSSSHLYQTIFQPGK